MILFISFFDYLFSYTVLSAVKLNYVTVMVVGVISLLVGLYGDIKPMLLWLPFYIFVFAHWWRFRFSAHFLIMYMSTMCFSAFVPYFNDKLRRRFIKTIVWFGLFFAFGCIFQKIMPQIYEAMIFSFFNGETKLFIKIAQSNGVYTGFSYQQTAAAGAITLGIIAVWSQFKKNKWSVVILILLYWGLFLTAKRMYFLISIVVPFIMYYYKSEKGKIGRLLVGVLLAVILGYVFNSLFVESDIKMVEKIGELTADNVDMDVATSGRGELIRKAMYQFGEHPLTGMGWGRFGAKYGTSVHNVYIQLLCETGIFGMASFVFCALIMLGKSVKKLKHTNENDNTKSILLLSVGIQFAFLIYSFTGNPLYDLQWIWMYFFMGAVSLTLKPEKSEEKS
ncbi:MAG: O-antigen ligase family protein [Ruminococcaceae bacterium]|nr:O-antigen ligase family protein [Oscillospiraceae bacterium]